ncbi:MAG TPA: hypothetical protein DG753_12650, partial [Clostridium sp.]|nr:hypothetical protein [Clostridium sp.]
YNNEKGGDFLIQRKIHNDNYETIDKTFSFTKGNLFGIFIAIPLIILCVFIYHIIYDNTPKSQSLLVIIGFIIGIFIHEFVHGFTWHIFCKEKWKNIKFEIDKRTLSPYATCSEILPINQYRLGALMPIIITGVLPYIIGLILNNSTIVYIGVFLISAGVGDLMILFNIMKEKSTSYCIDHPTLCGCTIYRRQNK